MVIQNLNDNRCETGSGDKKEIIDIYTQWGTVISSVSIEVIGMIIPIKSPIFRAR